MNGKQILEALMPRQQRVVHVIDQPVEGFVVSLTENRLARIARRNAHSVEVEYPVKYTTSEGRRSAYAVKGDVWFNYRPAMLSDVSLYDEDLWIEAALIAAEAETSA